MTSEQYKTALASLPFGKRLLGALYLVRPREEDVPAALRAVLQRAETASRPDAPWTLLKLQWNTLPLPRNTGTLNSPRRRANLAR
jgi:hypothetical protein